MMVRLDGDELRLEYSDTGKGIASSHLENIFEPLFITHRAHGGSTGWGCTFAIIL
jgi:signal transduction histidine kinase